MSLTLTLSRHRESELKRRGKLRKKERNLGTSEATRSRINYHHGAWREQLVQFVDVLIAHRDASGGPVYVAAVQERIVGAVDSYSSADAHWPPFFDRHDSAVAHLFVAA